VGVHRDVRTTDEIICDMVSEDKPFEDIAFRLQLSVPSVRARFEVIKARMGWLGD
jgi:hypothetical protein